MKRSYDYSFADEGRDYTYAMTPHSFEFQLPDTTQGAPTLTDYSSQPCLSWHSFGSGLPPYHDFKRPLLTESSGSNDDFQSNAAMQIASIAPRTDCYSTSTLDRGARGLGIHCNSVADQSVQVIPESVFIVKQEVNFDGFGDSCSPVPGGLLELLTKPHDDSAEDTGPSYVGALKASGMHSGDDLMDSVTALDDSLAFFATSESPTLSSLPSLLYPSSSDLIPGDFLADAPHYCSSDSMKSIKDALVNTSLFYRSSSTEDSNNYRPLKTALFYPSSSFGSMGDKGVDSVSATDSFGALLDLDSPLLGLEYDDRAVRQTEPVVGLYADINLRTVLATHEGVFQAYVNPADIMGQEEISVKIEEEQEVADLLADHEQLFVAEPEQDSPPAMDFGAMTIFTEEAVQAIVSVITAAKQEEDMVVSPVLPTPMDVPARALSLTSVPSPIVPQPTHFPFAPPSLGPPATAFTSSTLSAPQAYAPMVQLGPTTSLDHAPYAFFPSSLAVLPAPQRTPLLDRQPLTPTQPVQVHTSPCTGANAPPRVPHPQSPICNAHMGVELHELRRRAENYRWRNPGTDIDKVWLQAFSGRLSEDGVLIEEWRCYVKGCAQRNKRRDHILVHVGSHVEHRPFSCGRCGMRFLRKNECKRHEASHDGAKPYECPICAPVQRKSFARQDLLKRHMRVTHSMTGESGRKKIRIDDGEYHP